MKVERNLFGSSSTSELINRNISEFLHHDSKDLFKKRALREIPK